MTRTPEVPASPAVPVEVAQALLNLGYGAPTRVDRYPGRNNNWGITTSCGQFVFAKHLVGAESAARFHRLTTFESVTGTRGASGPLRAPVLLYKDLPRRLCIFTGLEDARSAAAMVDDGTFSVADARYLGEILAAVHDLVVPRDVNLNAAAPALPRRQRLQEFDVEDFVEFSGGELEVWALMQADLDLPRALSRLRDWQDSTHRVPIHGDLRIDQVLYTGNRWYLTDWENFGWGDAAVDVGGCVGEWLFRAVALIGQDTAPRADGEVASHDEIVGRGVDGISKMRPFIQALWRSYRSARSTGLSLDSTFRVRVVAWAGWHLFDRVLAGASLRGQISAHDRAVAGVGRTALLRPERFVAALGLSGGHET